MINRQLILVIIILALAECSPKRDAPATYDALADQAAASPITAPTNTPTVTPNPRHDYEFPASFPLQPLTQDQIQEVGNCDILALAEDRYPESIDNSHLPGAFSPISSCDWAVLAYAYATRNKSDFPSPLGLDALGKALSENYGFALATSLFSNYFGSLSLVNDPEFADQEITIVDIYYTWTGLGATNVEYALSIDTSNTEPSIISSSPLVNKDTVINKDTIQDLTHGLNNLLPVDTEKQLIYCTDNFPEWSVTLTFQDETQLTLESKSNLLYVGGPWFTKIKGQTYVQYSAGFVKKVLSLIVELDLPLGEPFGMYCSGGPIFESIFSRFLPPSQTPTPNHTREAIYTAAAQTVEAQLSTETPEPTP